MTTLLDGKTLSKKIINKVEQEISTLKTQPELAVVLVGTNPASQSYVRNKHRTAEKIGMKSIVIELDENVSEQNLIEQIDILNEDKNINAILVQLPLPKHLDPSKVIAHIDPIKDVDGLHPENCGKILSGEEPYAYPCTPKGIMELIEEYKINLEGLNAVVIGRSNLVGKPVSQMLLNKNATVTTAHSKTKNIESITKTADLIITAMGKPKFLKKEMVKENVIIIDVGFNKTEDGACGDVDFEDVKEKASFITPVPGGVGPMTIATLMQNTLDLYKIQNQIF